MALVLRFAGAAAIGYSIKPELLFFVLTMVGLMLFATGVTIDVMSNYKKGDKQDVNSDD